MKFLKPHYKTVFSFLALAMLISYSGNDAVISLKTPSNISWVANTQNLLSNDAFYLSHTQNSSTCNRGIVSNFLKHSLNNSQSCTITYSLQQAIYSAIKYRLQQASFIQESFFNTPHRLTGLSLV